MPLSKTMISLPKAQLQDMEEMARKENLTLSELIRNAYRGYRYRRTLKGLNESGRAVAADLGIAETDVVPIIRQFRKDRRARNINQPAE